MGFTCGIVGLPNVGKSTLFNALTKAGIAAANYPFCTIDPHVGVVPMPDKRLDALAKIVKPQKVIPTAMEFVDIAGLVAGASKGEGLGNQFLANIRETEAVAHIVRCFDDPDVIHVAGKVDPINDIETINTELILADLDAVEKAIQRVAKSTKSGDKDAIKQKALFERLKTHLDAGLCARTLKMDKEEQAFLKPLFLLTNKPVLYVANVMEDGLVNNPLVQQVEAYASKENAKVVVICAKIEAELAELADEEKEDFLKELGIDEPGLNKLIQAGYDLLGLQTYFTAGVKEVRAWTIPKGATAPQAAGKIHTDFERGFIRAEIISFEDFIKYNGEQGAKEAGRFRVEGKEYIVVDGDIIHFRFNV